VKIRYTNAAEDYTTFQKSHLATRMGYRRIIHILFLGNGLFVFGRYWLQHVEEQGAAMSITNGFLNALVTLALLYAGMALIERVFWWWTRRVVLHEKNNRFLCEHTLEITNTELIESTDVGTSTIRLDAIDSISSKDGYTIVYLSSNTAHVIPEERVIEGNVLQFLACLREKVAA
jgi:hypothetical protein